jgi:dienelactone hydrolase
VSSGISRRRRWALALLALLGAASALGVGLAAASPSQLRGAAATAPPPSFAVGIRVLRLVDGSRTIRLPSGRIEPRELVTYLRYPAVGAPGAIDQAGAPVASADGPFPLVVFAHGFAVTPALYAHLLQTWARAGYVVAAPVFPLENANAPGGPDESDLINQPTDMRFVISRVLQASGAGAGPLAGLVDPTRIAVAGHSDGGETALAAAYSRDFRDRRIGAAVILAGARMGGVGGFSFHAGSPPLLAAQGTGDTINDPKFTDAFYGQAHRPKFLLRLLGAEHLPPYTREQPQLGIVERVTVAFLDAYLKRRPGALQRLGALGSVPRTSVLLAQP